VSSVISDANGGLYNEFGSSSQVFVLRGVPHSQPTSTPIPTAQTHTGSKVMVNNQQVGTGMAGVFSSPSPMPSSLPLPQCPSWGIETMIPLKSKVSKIGKKHKNLRPCIILAKNLTEFCICYKNVSRILLYRSRLVSYIVTTFMCV